MSGVQIAALAGIGLNLAGVLTLFRYGMPFRVERKGASYMLLEETDYSEIAVERRYRLIGNIGLGLVVVGSGLQAFAVLLT